MSYHRKGFGDPITDPSQVDGSIIVGEVGPSRVGCAQLPADSPWKEPGEVCYSPPGTVAGAGGGILDLLGLSLDKLRTGVAAITGTTPTPTTAPAETSSGPPWLLLGGIAVGAYFLLRKKKGAA